jgi:serine phosphatase RsbU (regulator of sigma subunit)
MEGNAKVLIIDDEPVIRTAIAAYLEDSGFAVLEAGGGRLGIDLFHQENPDAVLCDLRMPGIDGLVVLSTITRESPDTPVIIVSGVNELDYAVQALKRGAWDYFTKPIQDMAVLENALRRALERADLIKQNRRYKDHLEALNRDLTRTMQQLREDEEAGRRIQFQLLPRDESRFGRYTFSRRLFPSAYLSGDFVDYFTIDDRNIGFYMADVSGHGAASAFVTVMLTTLVRAFLDEYRTEGNSTILKPELILDRLNREFCGQTFNKHLTMFYGVIDQQENRLVCCSAGQYPYPILANGKGSEFLPIQGVPVGLFNYAEYESRTVPLPDTFRLMLVSDGVLEIIEEPSLQGKGNALLARVADHSITMESLTVSLGVAAKTLPDDVAFLMVSKN